MSVYINPFSYFTMMQSLLNHKYLMLLFDALNGLTKTNICKLEKKIRPCGENDLISQQ